MLNYDNTEQNFNRIIYDKEKEQLKTFIEDLENQIEYYKQRNNTNNVWDMRNKVGEITLNLLAQHFNKVL